MYNFHYESSSINENACKYFGREFIFSLKADFLFITAIKMEHFQGIPIKLIHAFITRLFCAIIKTSNSTHESCAEQKRREELTKSLENLSHLFLICLSPFIQHELMSVFVLLLLCEDSAGLLCKL